MAIIPYVVAYSSILEYFCSGFLLYKFINENYDFINDAYMTAIVISVALYNVLFVIILQIFGSIAIF